MGIKFFSSNVPGVTICAAVGETRPVRMFHEWYSVPVLFSGSGVIRYRRKDIHGRPNLVNVMEPGEIHYSAIRTPVSCGVAQIAPDLFRSAAFELGYAEEPHFPVGLGSGDPDVSAAVSEFVRSSSAPSLIAEAAFSSMVATLLERCSEAKREQFELPCARAFDSVVEAARHTAPCPTVQQLAALEGTSLRQLHRTFKKSFGVSPVEAYQLVRVAKVVGDVDRLPSLAALAVTAGFSDQSHMNRVFRRVMHCSVGGYTRQLRSSTHAASILTELQSGLGRALAAGTEQRPTG